MTSLTNHFSGDDLAPSRRQVVKYGAAAAISATAIPPQPLLSADTVTVSGIVYENRSGAVRRQVTDRGIAGVLVSNGHEVVKTDAAGRYSLPIDDESVIFVIKPTGYAVPVNEEKLPRFYYIHQPNGSPQGLNLRYRGVDPTGQLPASVDFALNKTNEPQKFEVIVFADPQPQNALEVAYIRDDVINALIGSSAAFGITIGDIMFDDLSLYPRLNRIIGQIGLPWYNIGGNHDLNYEAPNAKYSRETFKRIYGPPYYAFEFGGSLFLMLDNVNYRGGGKYEGRFGQRQLDFIANVLREFPSDKLVVACMHIPLQTYLSPVSSKMNTMDGGEFLRLLANRPYTVSLSGHTHTTEHHYFGVESGFSGRSPHHHHVMTTVSGSWWSGPYDHRGIAVADSQDGSPNGFHILSVDGRSYSTRFQPAKEPNARQMRILLDSDRMDELFSSPLSQERAFATRLIVNFFDGGPNTFVEFQIGAREPIKMDRVARPDPFVEEEFTRNEATKKPWVKAVPSSHIWSAPLPAGLPPGTHCIAVRVIDEYGREHRDHLVLEVTAGDSAPKAPGG